MRTLVTAAFVTLDGVMQSPGAPDEDRSGGFSYGGWEAAYQGDPNSHGTAENGGRPFDLVLGRRTYDIFAGFWPNVKLDPAGGPFANAMMAIAHDFNRATKYVASRSRPSLSWRGSHWLGDDAVSAVHELKQGNGPELLTQGSTEFVQALLAADLVDELRLLIYPLTLGTGKRLWGEGTRPAAFRLTRSTVSPSGVISATYERAGAVRTASY